jgi:hypothetical protein
MHLAVSARKVGEIAMLKCAKHQPPRNARKTEAGHDLHQGRKRTNGPKA